MNRLVLTAVLAATAGSTVVVAKDRTPTLHADPDTVARLRACRTITSAEQRLACFDQAAQALDAAIARREVVVVDRQEVRRARRSLFGFELPSLRIFGGEKDEPPFAAIDSVVTAVSGAGYGKYDIAIEDGAVWRNIELLDAPPRVGDKVHIDKTAMGGYFFKTRFARAVRASRVR